MEKIERAQDKEMEWFRWYHDTTTDSKFKFIAKKCALRAGDIIATWAAFLEYASNAKIRGSLKGLNLTKIAFDLDISEEQISSIRDAMIEIKMITRDARVTRWSKRQRKSDIDPTNIDRQKRYRDRRKEIMNNALRSGNDYAPDTDTDTDTEDSSVNEFTSSSNAPCAREEEDEKISEPMKHSIEKAIDYFGALKGLKLVNPREIVDKIPSLFLDIKKNNPKIRPFDLLEAWKSAMDAAKEHHAKSEKWLMKTFFDKLEGLGIVVRGP